MTELEWLREEYAKSRTRMDFERERYNWSRNTFGDVGPMGPIRHLREEIDELEKAISSNSHNAIREEAADIGLLYRDIVDRLDIKFETHQADLKAKLDKNKARDWPPAVDGEACHHKKKQAASFTVERLDLGESKTLKTNVYAYHVAGCVYCHRRGRSVFFPQAMPYIGPDVDMLIGCLKAAQEDALELEDVAEVTND